MAARKSLYLSSLTSLLAAAPALTTYMNTGETYAQLRTDCLQAASDLYGAASPEYAAVQNAFHGINVGDPAPGN